MLSLIVEDTNLNIWSLERSSV